MNESAAVEIRKSMTEDESLPSVVTSNRDTTCTTRAQQSINSNQKRSHQREHLKASLSTLTCDRNRVWKGPSNEWIPGQRMWWDGPWRHEDLRLSIKVALLHPCIAPQSRVHIDVIHLDGENYLHVFEECKKWLELDILAASRWTVKKMSYVEVKVYVTGSRHRSNVIRESTAQTSNRFANEKIRRSAWLQSMTSPQFALSELSPVHYVLFFIDFN